MSAARKNSKNTIEKNEQESPTPSRKSKADQPAISNNPPADQPISFSTRHIQKIAKEIARERRRPLYIQLTIILAVIFTLAFAAYSGGSYIKKTISQSKIAEIATFKTAKKWYMNTTKPTKRVIEKTRTNNSSKKIKRTNAKKKTIKRSSKKYKRSHKR